MTTLIYTHEDCLEHRPGPHHPESPERLRAVLAALEAPEFAKARWREAPLGTREQVLLVHTADYVASVEAMAPMEGYQLLDAGDTIMSPGTLQAVMRCVGAACAAVDAVVAKEARNAFCATRPCGHHAEADRAMGFCVYNQAAIAALHARHAHGIRRIAVVVVALAAVVTVTVLVLAGTPGVVVSAYTLLLIAPAAFVLGHGSRATALEPSNCQGVRA